MSEIADLTYYQKNRNIIPNKAKITIRDFKGAGKR